MFGGLFTTIFGKIAAVVVTVGGVAGGMAAAGSLPIAGQDVAVSTITAAGPETLGLPTGGGVPLVFPELPKFHQAVIDQGAQGLAATASTQAVRGASQAERNAAKAAAAAQKCLDELTAQVNALVAGIPGITTQEQATAMVAQAKAIADGATACAKQATALGQQGIDQVNNAAAQLNSAVAQLGALQTAAGQAVHGAQNAVGDAAKSIDKASGSAFGMFKQITDMAAALMSTATEYQQKFQTPGPVTNLPVPTQPAPTGNTGQFGQWGNLGSWMQFAEQMQQNYGTSFNVSSSSETESTGGSGGFRNRR